MLTQLLTFPNIDPVLLELGPLKLRWYGLMYLFGFMAAMWLANRKADQANSGWTREQVSDLLFFGFLGVILGGRIGYVLFYQTARFLDDPLYLIQIWSGGMSFHGGLLGVIFAILWFARKNQKRFLDVGDFVAPLIPMGLGLGRLGNFINGELWGRVTDLPWAMIFPAAEAGGLPRHPSQLYEFALEGVLLFILLQWYSRKPRKPGAVGGLFLVGYGVARFSVEFVRQPDGHLGLLEAGMSMGQWLSAPMVLIGLFLMLRPVAVKGKGAQA